MHNKKGKQIIAAVIAVLMVLAMILPMAADMLI